MLVSECETIHTYDDLRNVIMSKWSESVSAQL